MKIKKMIAAMFPVFLLFTGCFKEEKTPVNADFAVTIQDNDYSVPVRMNIENHTTGADHYLWTFEGGEPSSSESSHPGMVTYHTAGTYTIRLEAWNDDERKTRDFSLVLDSAVLVAFDVDMPVNNISPVEAVITNTTRGALSCLWNFGNGDPETSQSFSPASVIYTQPGEHIITLLVSNGREQYSLSKTIQVLPSMQAGFIIEPSFDDFDMEAPWTGTLSNTTVSGLTYMWSASGGTIADPQAESPRITFDVPGTYNITLEAQNGKEVQTQGQTVTIKENTNLYTIADIKLGSTTAHASVGCFFSCLQRRVLTQGDMSAPSPPPVDLVFFGMGPLFPYCRFVSPDAAGSLLVFDDIPDAGKTYFVNKQATPIFTVADFDAMLTDAPLRNLDIRSMDTGDQSFAAQTPYIVLFETASGRKGVIKIKGYIAEGNNSYILADVKVMKN
ncbi:MAG: PKD domain-containing protein [Bacteroidales bacterium]|nr:PKD domain-containing protein [Bacteroidales bacterium]